MLEPRFRSAFPSQGLFGSSNGVPTNELDAVQIAFTWSADRLIRPDGVDLGGCSDVEVFQDMRIQLVETDFLWREVSAVGYAQACGSTTSFPPVPDADFVQAISSGNVPDCSSGPEVLQEVDQVHWRNEFNVRNPSPAEATVLIGYKDYNGHRVGAHDIIAWIQSYTQDFSGNCGSPGGLRRSNATSGIRKQFNKQLPLGLQDAIMEQALFDPQLVGLQDVPCDTEDPTACGWPDRLQTELPAPAFRAQGEWRGVRHVCKLRDSSSSPLGGFITRPDKNVCHFQVEPKRINIRPDGVEVVFVDDRTEHVQGDVLVEDATTDINNESQPYAPLPALLCDDNVFREGRAPQSGDEPDEGAQHMFADSEDQEVVVFPPF